MEAGMREPSSVALVARDLWRAQQAGAVGIRRRQTQRLRALVAFARGHSRFYQRLYADLPRDGVALTDLPPTAKPMLMDAYDEWVTDERVSRADVEAFVADPERVGRPYRDGLFVCETSGTTGSPGLFVHDRRAIAVCRALTLVRVDLARMSIVDWFSAARRSFRWAAVLGTGAHFGGVGWVEYQRRSGGVQSGQSRVFSILQPTPALVAAVDAFDPAIITGYPSAMELLAGEQEAGRLHVRPAFVTTAGETLAPKARARVARAFGSTTVDVYGASEFQIIAVGCAYDWLHVNEDWVILEPVDESLRPVALGEASHSVLLTNLADRLQPLIRYDLGDSVRVSPDLCPCGSPLRAIRVAGRRDDVLLLRRADGKPVTLLPLAIGAVIEQARGLRRSQVVQVDVSTLQLRLEPREGIHPRVLRETVERKLATYLAELGLDNVRLIHDPDPPRADPVSGKFRQVLAGSSCRLHSSRAEWPARAVQRGAAPA
jgi:phenylacetate-CoA ligase